MSCDWRQAVLNHNPLVVQRSTSNKELDKIRGWCRIPGCFLASVEFRIVFEFR